MTGRARVLMVQGTTSSAGKSFLVTGLCRLFARRGLSVAPFKAQNMSNNAAVTDEGLEIGRAQAVQAQAAMVRPHVDMNPVLLKPEADHRSQVVLMGRPVATLDAADYERTKGRMWGEIAGALDRLRSRHDLVIIEGAGSPAEINLRDRDLANMRVALHAEAPVLIVGDIDRGGVFAHFYGTHALLAPAERSLVKGFVINRFRGDAALLAPAPGDLKAMTGVPVVGVIPWIHHHGIPEEDAVAIEDHQARRSRTDRIDVAVIALPRIANFDDFDPLAQEDEVTLRYVDDPSRFGDPDIVVIPGTKSTVADLTWLRERGLDSCIRRASAAGAAIIGICGGYQMLGTSIDDEHGTESATQTARGLGLLAVSTRFSRSKRTTQTSATITSDKGMLAGLLGARIEGYEIHAGESLVNGVSHVAASLDDRVVAATGADGWVFGCYLHGLFHNNDVRQRLLGNVAARRDRVYHPTAQRSDSDAFDALASVFESSLDMPLIRGLVGLR